MSLSHTHSSQLSQLYDLLCPIILSQWHPRLNPLLNQSDGLHLI